MKQNWESQKKTWKKKITTIKVTSLADVGIRWQMFFKVGVRPATSLKRDSNTDVFLWNLRNIYTFFCRTPLLWWLLLPVNSLNQWKHTLKVYAAENEMIYLNGTSKVSVSRKWIFIWVFPNIVGSTPF